MKKSLLLSGFIAAASAMTAQDCSELFISEYTVGAGNNKAYELYNPTDQPITLTGVYELQRWSNGETSSTDHTSLEGVIPAFGTWVVANGQTEDIDLGTYISPACDPELQALADQLDNPYPAPTFMNGNDALVLVKNGNVICDIFGRPGEDPGVAWSAPDGTFITNNQTMVRKFEVTLGVTMIPTAFLPLMEYDTLGTQNWSNLGIHDCECHPLVSVRNVTESLDIQIYPNPAANDQPITITSNYAITGMEVYDLTGRKVPVNFTLVNSRKALLQSKGMVSGGYIVNVLMENNVGFSTRIVVQ